MGLVATPAVADDLVLWLCPDVLPILSVDTSAFGHADLVLGSLEGQGVGDGVGTTDHGQDGAEGAAVHRRGNQGPVDVVVEISVCPQAVLAVE